MFGRKRRLFYRKRRFGIESLEHRQLLTSFADDFNRADGPVNNDWSSWHNNTFDQDAQITIVDGQLETHGANRRAILRRDRGEIRFG